MTAIEITDQRELNVDRAGQWRAVIFDHGARYLLSVNSDATQFQVHFTAEQWAEFQKLVQP